MKTASTVTFLLCLASCDAQEQGSRGDDGQEPENLSYREQLGTLRTRLEGMEAQLAEQRREREAVDALILAALNRTVEKLDEFLRAAYGGELRPGPPMVPARAETPGTATATWVSLTSLTAAVVALLWNLRSPLHAVQLWGELMYGRSTLGTPRPDTTRTGSQPAKEPSSLDITERPLSGPDMSNGQAAGATHVQWTLACADPEVGENLALGLLASEPLVLETPPPSARRRGRILSIGYCVDPHLSPQDRDRLGELLCKTLRSVPAPSPRVRELPAVGEESAGGSGP